MFLNKLIKKTLLSLMAIYLLSFSLISIGLVSAVKVQIPEGNRQSDVIVTPDETQIQSNEKDIFEFIQIINKYLWFSIGAVSLIGIIIGGFRLLTSEGDEESNKKTSKMLLGAAVGLGIAMLSYTIIRLIVNLL